LTPSVFTRSQVQGVLSSRTSEAFFRCPTCSHDLIDETGQVFICAGCNTKWPIVDGIYDFRGKD
jgi:Zn finger protein HypA/HybF involved in hydrogenase expression